MKKLFWQAFDFLLFSNVFMALCAVAQGLVTFYLIGAKPVEAVLGILFTSTLAIYNFSILYPKPANPQASEHRRAKWFFSHSRLMITFTIVCTLSLIPLFFLLSTESGILLIFLAVISVAYNIPIFTLGDQKFGLRNIPGLKQFLITLVWTMSTVLLPVMEAQHHHLTVVSLRDITILIAKRFLLIGALTIPFDIRDLFEDRQSGLKTVAVVWGEKKALIFCQVLLAGYLILLFLYHNGGFSPNFVALTLTVLLAGWLIFKSSWEKNEYYYFFYVDGVLILQYLFLLGVNWVWRAI